METLILLVLLLSVIPISVMLDRGIDAKVKRDVRSYEQEHIQESTKLQALQQFDKF